MQNQLQGQFFSALRARNVFINQPDMYFYQGGSKTGMGYNEVQINATSDMHCAHPRSHHTTPRAQDQYSLPRWQDITVSRQGMYDDTYHFIPTQGWMFVPLVSCDLELHRF